MNQTVIVFQEDCILAASGREGEYPALVKAERVELQGQGDVFEGWRRAVSGLGAEWKEAPVRLVLPAALCSTRVLQLPYGRGKQMEAMASREIAESFRGEVTDYSVARREKRSSIDICAGGVDAGNLERFVEICRDAGITPGGVTVPLEGYLRVLRQTEGYEKRTAVYLFFEEGRMTSVLCRNGRYLYSSRSRLFSEPGTLDFGTEIVRNISGILQFYAGNERNSRITEVYYAGCAAEDFEVSVEGIRNLGLCVYPMEICAKISVPAGEDAADWLPCIGAMTRKTRKEKQINLRHAGKDLDEKKEKGHGGWRHFVLPAAAAALCLGAYGAVFVLNQIADHTLESQQEWMADLEIQEKYARAGELDGQLAKIRQGMDEVKLMGQNLSVYPEFSGEMLRRIGDVGGDGIEFDVSGFDAETGVLTFHVKSREIIDIPAYILKLQETGLFHTVDYTGYVYEEEWYILSLSCTLEGEETGGAQ